MAIKYETVQSASNNKLLLWGAPTLHEPCSAGRTHKDKDNHQDHTVHCCRHCNHCCLVQTGAPLDISTDVPNQPAASHPALHTHCACLTVDGTKLTGCSLTEHSVTASLHGPSLPWSGESPHHPSGLHHPCCQPCPQLLREIPPAAPGSSGCHCCHQPPPLLPPQGSQLVQVAGHCACQGHCCLACCCRRRRA